MGASLFPALKLDHLYRLTDCTGIIQHAHYALPEYRTGYTTDDNARALLVAARFYANTREERLLDLAGTYLSFLAYAQRPDGLWRNFVAYTREFSEDLGSEDAFGRAFMAASFVAAEEYPNHMEEVAARLVERAAVHLERLVALRAKAFCLLGLSYGQGRRKEMGLGLVRVLADSLTAAFHQSSDRDWAWFEGVITYCNAVLPEALLAAYQLTGKREYFQVGRQSLDFLCENLLREGKLKVVGNQGWWVRGGRPALFDEQPVDAGHMVTALALAYQLTQESYYREAARTAFAWFLGKNSLGLPLYDPVTGGCFDGLRPEGVNQNQGAESLLAYLAAYLDLSTMEVKRHEATG